MGKKSTTVETGLGDQQYQTLANNQANIAGGINDLSTQAQTGFDTITTNQQTLRDGQSTLWEQGELNTGKIVANTNQNTKALQDGQGNILTAVQNIPKVDLSGVTSSINALEGTTQAGFNNMGSRFDTVDSTLTGLGSKIDTGFTGVNENIAAGNETLLNTMGSRFDTSDATRQEQFDQAEANRAAMQELILTGQVSMTDLINQYGQAGAEYYADLAGNQATMMDQNAGLQQGLTAFQDTYTQNVDMEAKRFGELQDQMVGGFDAVRGGQTDLSSAVSGVRDAVSTQAAAGTQAVYGAGQQAYAAPEIDYSRIAKEVATGVADQTDGGFTNGQMFASKLDTIRNILTNQGDQLDFRIRDQYTRLANSFDSQGKLIASSVDQNGIQTARAIDQQGNLLIAAFDQTGQKLMQDSLSINAMMQAFDQQMKFQMGGNYAMGNLSPAYNRGKGGLASPYSYSYR